MNLNLNLAQIAWVIKDITVTERFFKHTLGISKFSKVEISRANDYDGTYYGKPSNAENLVSIAYSGGVFIELIQPISGNSIFKIILKKILQEVFNTLHIRYPLLNLIR